jgi:RNA polymerase sigma-70 factor (ECF subfamily)
MRHSAGDDVVIPFGEDVADGVRRGDPDAVGEVYVHLADRLLGYLVARVRDRATAEDLLEATFIELLRKGHTITGGPAAIKVWLFRSAYFNALDHIRKVKRRHEDITDDFAGIDLEDPGDGPADTAVRAERRDMVRAAMAHLSEDQRAVLQMRYVAELSAPEVAVILGKTEGAVRSLQHRGERALGRLLQDAGGHTEFTRHADRDPGAPSDDRGAS